MLDRLRIVAQRSELVSVAGTDQKRGEHLVADRRLRLEPVAQMRAHRFARTVAGQLGARASCRNSEIRAHELHKVPLVFAALGLQCGAPHRVLGKRCQQSVGFGADRGHRVGGARWPAAPRSPRGWRRCCPRRAAARPGPATCPAARSAARSADVGDLMHHAPDFVRIGQRGPQCEGVGIIFAGAGALAVRASRDRRCRS